MRKPRGQQRRQNGIPLTVPRPMVPTISPQPVCRHLLGIFICINDDGRRLPIPFIIRQIGRDMKLHSHNVPILALFINLRPLFTFKLLPRHYIPRFVEIVRIHQFNVHRVHYTATSQRHQQCMKTRVILNELDIRVHSTPFIWIMNRILR